VPHVIGLPVYLPIRVKVAIGMAGSDNAAAFKQHKQRIAGICSVFDHRQFTPCQGLYKSAKTISLTLRSRYQLRWTQYFLYKVLHKGGCVL